MKVITRLCVAASLAGILAGCTTKQEVTPELSFTGEAASLLSSGISAPASGTEVELTFHSAASWVATADDGATKAHAGWVVIDPAAGKGGEDVTVKITLHENPELEGRSAVITFASGDIAKTMQVSQAGRERQPITEVLLSDATLELEIDQTYTLVATVLPSYTDDDKTVTWSSSKPAVASVKDGLVTALSAGTTVITVKAGSKSASCTVTVVEHETPPEPPVEVASITLDQTEVTLKEGESATLVATVLPADADDPTVTWSSSNPDVATVSDGVVTAVKAGTAMITAQAGSKVASCTVTVIEEETPPVPPVEVESITLDQTEVTLFEGETITLVATVLPADADDPTVTWTSSNPDIVSVDANGVVTAQKAGTAVITAKAGDKTATCTVTVEAIPEEDPGSGGEDLGDDIDVDPWK